MPVERWSTAQITALAPDASSLKGARGVSSASKWQEAGLLDEVLWGLCRGSGKNPYQVCVDLAGPVYKCSCPSRKFPCKHALGLLLHWAEGGGFTAPAPAFVSEWQASRAAKVAAPKTTGTADPAAAQKRALQRADRVAAGMTELRRWLDDQVHQGLAGAEQAGHRPYETMAARLVDAQAPTAASAVRRLGGVAGIGPHWADRLLGDLALLRLLVAGHERLDTLPDALAATVRARIGFPVATEDVLATTPVRDEWQVLGQVDSEDGAITTRRTWLLGVSGGRFALVLSFAAPGQSLTADLLPGTTFDGALCFYPGAAPLRALVKEKFGTPRPLTTPSGARGLRDALAGWSTTVAAEPWRYDAPVLLAGVVPGPDGFLVDAAGESLPLAPGHREPWWLLAAAGGRPATVAGEWSPSGLRPLAAWVRGQFLPAAAPVPDGPSVRGPELPADLLAAALVGTARRPWSSPDIHVGDRVLTMSKGGELLEAAGAALVYRRAGITPSAGHAPVEAAPVEIDRPLPEAAGARLLRLLTDGGAPGGAQQAQELLSQWLFAAAQRGGFVPPESLPALLDAGRRNSAVRPAIGRIAGQRGTWLARMRPDWKWLSDEAPGTATSDDPEIWETGTGGERLAYLTKLRGTDPGAALALLESTWKTEAPEDRARFLGALDIGLSPADDTFLDRALDDRRKEVRETALDLLQRLPGSSLGQRMAARATAAVRLERRTFGRDRLLADPPTELTPDLRRDGVAAQPSRGTGVQAWLLEEIIAGTPLTTWTEAFDRSPAAVVDLARNNDWETPLLHGWAKAAIVQADPTWAAALVRNDTRESAAGLREAVRWDLHLLLPPADLARIAADFLRREDHLAHRLLAVHPGAWPDELAVAVVETIAHRARTDKHSWQLAELCRAAAMAMPPKYAMHVAGLAEQLDQQPADPSRVRPVAELARTLIFRAEMLDELASE
ncbi:SWIM zinc finger family protein [Actinoplanes friuliensis]|uniref:Zinc finger SWIM domain-containing protein n=1 Tax=Actinoplanes friuliensis DSM 7358 TaxID=1246995 RepID=U5W6D2_9ACTN|nr:SWIM zinc finger family protein [Actinoplanes friuliensis]AGZ44699.1 zinc finger SWIM domain-containing protein [Actinoplanes friuliensis DSM 7358]